MSDGGDALTLIAIAGIGFATGGLAIPALAAGAGAGAAAGTAAAATATSFSLTSAVLGASTALQIGSTIMQGQAAADAANFEAAQADLQARTEETQAAIEEEDRQKRLRSMLSTQNAVFAASNITGGIEGTLSANALSESNRQTRLNALASDTTVSQFENQAAASRSAAGSAKTASYVKAGTSLLNFAGTEFDKRGT